MDNNIDPTTYLVEILDYYKRKLLNGGCTLEEVKSVTKAMVENMEIDGTIRDFAEFYGVPETTIRTNIFKKLFDKPKRRVLYPFHKFSRIVPPKWHKNR